jgi:hypothetical protein
MPTRSRAEVVGLGRDDELPIVDVELFDHPFYAQTLLPSPTMRIRILLPSSCKSRAARTMVSILCKGMNVAWNSTTIGCGATAEIGLKMSGIRTKPVDDSSKTTYERVRTTKGSIGDDRVIREA